MKNICFIGAFDKLDLILYLSKILKKLKKKILIIDATELQKARYVVPRIKPTKSYITRFEDIDIAVGFNSYEEIEMYIGFTEGQKTKYDYALVNIDNKILFNNFNNQNTIKNYFVTSFDLYNIRKGLDVLKVAKKTVEITKVLFSNNINQENNYYLDYLSLGYKISWNKKQFEFPYLTEDLEVMMENQKKFKIRIKDLSQFYKHNLELLIMDMVTDVDVAEVKKVMKNIEKEG